MGKTKTVTANKKKCRFAQLACLCCPALAALCILPAPSVGADDYLPLYSHGWNPNRL